MTAQKQFRRVVRFHSVVVAAACLPLFHCGCHDDAIPRGAAGDADRPQRVDELITDLEDESESVRRQAHRALSESLNRKVPFDALAPADQRAAAIQDIRRTWKNLVERDLVDAVKKRMPLQYFFDLNTSEIFEERPQWGPIETSSGLYQGMPAGVRAMVVACDNCAIALDRRVAWVFAPARVLQQHGIAFVGEELDQFAFAIRRSDGGEWALEGTPAALAIANEALRCGQSRALRCIPGR